MAKRRERPVGNPLMGDMVGDIVGEVTTRPAPPPPETTEPPPEQPQKPVQTRKPRRPAPAKKPTPARTGSQNAETKVQIKARFSSEEAADIERFTRTLSRYVGSKIKTADITRALWILAIRSEDQLADLTAKAPSMPRPSYGSSFEMAEYRDQITEFLLLALKNTPKA